MTTPHWPSTAERVSSTKFLVVHITEDLTWTTNTMSLSKKAQQRLYFLRWLKRASLPPPILATFYRGTIESVLTSCITVWYGNCSAADRKTLQRTVNTAAKIIGAPLPSILDIFLTRCSSKPTASWRTPPTVSFSACHQEDGTGASETAPPDCSTAFSPRLWEPWTQITPPPLKPHANPYLLKHGPSLPPLLSKHPPTLPHQREKKKKYETVCAIQSVLHTGEGPVQTTCSDTLSSMRTRHFSHTAVYTIPQKTQQYMYVYMLMHYKPSCTVPQPAAWLTMFLFAHVQYLCEAFVVCIFFLVCIG